MEGRRESLSGLKCKIKYGGTRFERERETVQPKEGRRGNRQEQTNKTDMNHARVDAEADVVALAPTAAIVRGGYVQRAETAGLEASNMNEDGDALSTMKALAIMAIPPPVASLSTGTNIKHSAVEQKQTSNTVMIQKLAAPPPPGEVEGKSKGEWSASIPANLETQAGVRAFKASFKGDDEQQQHHHHHHHHHLIPPPRRKGTSRISGNNSSRGSSDRNEGDVIGDNAAKTRSKEVEVVEWKCRVCEKACIPVRSESRCICGHRLKDHPNAPSRPLAGAGGAGGASAPAKGGRSASKSGIGGFKAWACTSARCPCPRFKFIMAEGAWILRCRCKHKHIEHDCVSPYRCKKRECVDNGSCNGFDSPFVCNCNHPWADHEQLFVRKVLSSPFAFNNGLDAVGNSGMDLTDLGNVQRTDLQTEPLDLLSRGGAGAGTSSSCR